MFTDLIVSVMCPRSSYVQVVEPDGSLMDRAVVAVEASVDGYILGATVEDHPSRLDLDLSSFLLRRRRREPVGWRAKYQFALRSTL
ncbi:MAG TPA: hypothetical protein DEP84_10940 [Chloroflexi bacterium]|nr:hypothetical protein [Chloroflexota bacterium]